MKKFYLIAAVLVLIGLNFLYKTSGLNGEKLRRQVPREPSATSAPNSSAIAPDSAAVSPVSETLTWLKQEAPKVGLTDAQPAETLNRIRERAARLTLADRIDLKTVATNPQHPTDERFLAVFVLSESPGADGADQLQEISQLPIAKTDNDRQYSDELVIRMQALDASVKKLPTPEAKIYLQKYLARIEDPQLAKHARYLQK